MIKVYSLIYDFALCTPVEVEGNTVNIVFSGGCKAMRQNGEFCTGDKKLQEAIEKSPGFNKVYKLTKTYTNKEPSPGNDAPEVPQETTVLQEKICRTVNEAADWLVELGYKRSDVNTSVKAATAAREQGYELKFEKRE